MRKAYFYEKPHLKSLELNGKCEIGILGQAEQQRMAESDPPRRTQRASRNPSAKRRKSALKKKS
jgi:hypothetical protein